MGVGGGAPRKTLQGLTRQGLRQLGSKPPPGCSLGNGAWRAGRAAMRCFISCPAMCERPKPEDGGGWCVGVNGEQNGDCAKAEALSS